MTAGFNDRILNNLVNVADKVLKTTQKAGVLLYARHNVQIVKRLAPGKKPQYGFIGEPVDQKIQLDPQPSVDLRTQFRHRDGIVVTIGDAKLSNIPQTYTREELTQASHFLIDDQEYYYVGGSLKDQVAGIFWELVLKKREQTKK